MHPGDFKSTAHTGAEGAGGTDMSVYATAMGPGSDSVPVLTSTATTRH